MSPRTTAPVFLFLLLLGAACVPPAGAQRGAITRPQPLPDLVDEAGVIVRGRVVSARVEPHPQMKVHTVVVQLRVEESLKGSPGETYTFRQYIWDARDRRDAAGYRKGQHLLLLLTTPNANGLSAPAGLEQGRFLILRDKDGGEYAVNGHGNAGLLRDVPQRAARKGLRLSPEQAQLAAQHRSGPIERHLLTGLVRQLAGGKQ